MADTHTHTKKKLHRKEPDATAKETTKFGYTQIEKHLARDTS